MGLLDFFKAKRVQSCLILTEDGRIVTSQLKVEKGYMVDHKTMEGWGLFPDSCVLKKGTNVLYELICERDAVPIPLDGEGSRRLSEDIINKIAEENCDQELAQIVKKSIRNRLLDTLRTVILIFAVLIVVMIVFGLITTGKLHLPSF